MKRKIKTLPLIITCLIVLGLILGIIFLNKNEQEKPIIENYLANNKPQVELYDEEFNKVLELPRGTKVIIKEDVQNEEQNYKKIEYENNTYLVKEENINEQIVLEKEIYVRTPCILYENEKDGKILSHLKKGEKLEITGYDYLKDGNVNMYKVKDGYAYAKYLDQDEIEANKYYDNGSYEIHKKRTNVFGGGDAETLDYYPYIKPKFEENIMPEEVKSLYINKEAIKNIDEYIELAKQTKINAFVVDIKDNASTAYKSNVMKELSPTNYNNADMTIEEYKNQIKKIKDNNFYVIGRITTFKDDYYAIDNKEDTIYDTRTNEPFNHNNSLWPSAYSRNVWYFNVELAKEAIKEFEFNEIQFDYVRFPDRTSNIEPYLDFKNKYNETKAQAIQGFVMYACDELHKLNVYVSIDVFAESAHQYVTGYGQYLPAISNIADVVSPMPYPDHFSRNEYGIKEPVWTVPYKLIKEWAGYVQDRQKETTTPAIIRTWIQTYDTIHEPYITYDSSKVSDQIKALYDTNIKNGFITWNSGSSLVKYKSLSEAFNKDYKE